MRDTLATPQVHVHLDAGRSPGSWRRLVEARRVWDEDPYGYQTLADFYSLTYSLDVNESTTMSLCRRGARKVLGFDFLHAWRDRLAIRRADIVVTHTEHEFLAVLLLLRILGDDRHKVICQAVWLWDRWARISRLRRLFYLRLMKRGAVLTVHSRHNLAIAAGAGHGRPTLLLPYGIRPLPRLRLASPTNRPPRIVAAGNDQDRDWPVLAAAVERMAGAEVRVRSRRRHARRAFEGLPVEVRPPRSIDEYWADLDWCDVVVVPLRKNSHASGLTVALEAVSAGRPVVVADVGGLRDYFGNCVHYYDEGDVASLVDALRRAATLGSLAVDGSASLVVERGLRSIDYARRHVLLIEDIVQGSPPREEISRFAAPEVEGTEQ